MRKFNKIILPVFTLLFALSISVSNAQDYKGCPVSYKVTPEVLIEKGDIVHYEISVTFPERYLNRRAAFDVKPVLKYGCEELALTPQTFIGEKVEGVEGIVVPYVEGGTFTFSGAFNFVPEMENAVLEVNPPDVYVPNLCNVIDYGVKADQIKIADGIIHTEDFAGGNEELLYVVIEENTEITQPAKLFFPVGSFSFNENFGLNKDEKNINDRIALNNFLANAYDINVIDIDAFASPEGYNAQNETLSKNRAKTTISYLKNEFDILLEADDSKLTTDYIDAIEFKINKEIPDWDGFVKAVEASDISNKDEIISTLNGEARDTKLNKLLAKYPKLRTLLPQLRRSEIAATYIAPKRDFFEWEVKVNNAIKEIENGNYCKAMPCLEKANELSPDNVIVINNMGVVYAKKGDWEKAKTCFTKAQNLGANEDYNLGVTAIQFGEYDKALELFGSKTCDVNVGLAQLMSEKYEDAKANLSCADETCKVNYLLAVVAARTANDADVFSNLKKAFEKHPDLKEKALNDREFLPYFDNDEFLSLMK